jgi:hypothetical protein
MECSNKQKNQTVCSCTYPGCPRHGICCECIRHHQHRGEIPGCLFPEEAEKTYDRSLKYFLSVNKK